MTKRDSFLLRIDPQVLAELRRWADDDMRSINGQIEYLLRHALQQAGRISKKVREQDIALDKEPGTPPGNSPSGDTILPPEC